MPDPDLQTSFYFNLSIAGSGPTVDAAFQEVSGLSKELGIEEVVCGGENSFKYRLPTTTTYPNLVLKRGIILSSSPLIQWCEDTLERGLMLPIQPKNITLQLLNPEGQACMTWSFVKAYPIKWAMSDLKSQESTLLIETIEFAYRYFSISDARASGSSIFG